MLNLPCQTLMAWNGLALADYVGSGAKLALTGLLDALPIMWVRGFTIP